MNQIPNREETNSRELEIVEDFNKFIKKWCGNNFPHLIDSDENDGEEFRDKLRDLHHQLQKTRHAWLREEIEFVKQVQAVEPKSNGRYNACNEILERYHSELTQDKK